MYKQGFTKVTSMVNLINKNANRDLAGSIGSNSCKGTTSMITYLYHKRHVKTGLNYFGKTTRDPYNYVGSGVYWKKHLEKHGKEIETIQVWKFYNVEECKNFAIEFSIKNSIVESSDWANLAIENGIDGQVLGYKYGPRSDETKKLIKESIIKSNSSRSKKLKGKNNPMYGKEVTSITKKKLSESHKNKVWWTNGIDCKMSIICPSEGYVRGRLDKSHKNNLPQNSKLVKTPTGTFISITAAAQSYKVSFDTIKRWVKSKEGFEYIDMAHIS